MPGARGFLVSPMFGPGLGSRFSRWGWCRESGLLFGDLGRGSDWVGAGRQDPIGLVPVNKMMVFPVGLVPVRVHEAAAHEACAELHW